MDRAMSNYRTLDIPVSGGNARVAIFGPADPAAPTLLAVHGVTASHVTFGLLAKALPEVRIIAPDLRGRGRSNRLPGPYGMPVHADDLAAILTHLDTGKVNVLGHSMGAFVSLVFAHRHPELVENLLLVDGGLPLQVPAGLKDEQIVEAILGPAAQRLAMTFESRQTYREFWQQHPAFIGHWNELVQDYVDYDLDEVDGALRPATSYRALAEDTAELHRGASLLVALDELAHPVRFLQSPKGLLGVAPGLYDMDYVRSWQEKLPQLQVEVIEDSNHYSILMDSPWVEEVAARVRQLLAPVNLSSKDASGE